MSSISTSSKKEIYKLIDNVVEKYLKKAKELTELKQKDKNFPEISIIFMNEEADLIPDFFKFAGAEYANKHFAHDHKHYVIVQNSHSDLIFWNIRINHYCDHDGKKNFGCLRNTECTKHWPRNNKCRNSQENQSEN